MLVDVGYWTGSLVATGWQPGLGACGCGGAPRLGWGSGWASGAWVLRVVCHRGCGWVCAWAPALAWGASGAFAELRVPSNGREVVTSLQVSVLQEFTLQVRERYRRGGE